MNGNRSHYHKNGANKTIDMLFHLKQFLEHPILLTALWILGGSETGSEPKQSRRISFSDERGYPLTRTTTFSDVESSGPEN